MSGGVSETAVQGPVAGVGARGGKRREPAAGGTKRKEMTRVKAGAGCTSFRTYFT
ncbi:hypothetical protein PCA31118_00634 [Pandoraea captiosa]|uniref:Uncharacterized protein n=1 Tax=Pandoraea captiosa TaxID=2508302 RepID=A0A5E4ZLU9_9BURK|nr:hypothetical protein PCA31118_00634 [Pandoraea captiosa]